MSSRKVVELKLAKAFEEKLRASLKGDIVECNMPFFEDVRGQFRRSLSDEVYNENFEKFVNKLKHGSFKNLLLWEGFALSCSQQERDKRLANRNACNRAVRELLKMKEGASTAKTGRRALRKRFFNSLHAVYATYAWKRIMRDGCNTVPGVSRSRNTITDSVLGPFVGTTSAVARASRASRSSAESAAAPARKLDSSNSNANERNCEPIVVCTIDDEVNAAFKALRDLKCVGVDCEGFDAAQPEHAVRTIQIGDARTVYVFDARTVSDKRNLARQVADLLKKADLRKVFHDCREDFVHLELYLKANGQDISLGLKANDQDDYLIVNANDEDNSSTMKANDQDDGSKVSAIFDTQYCYASLVRDELVRDNKAAEHSRIGLNKLLKKMDLPVVRHKKHFAKLFKSDEFKWETVDVANNRELLEYVTDDVRHLPELCERLLNVYARNVECESAMYARSNELEDEAKRAEGVPLNEDLYLHFDDKHNLKWFRADDIMNSDDGEENNGISTIGVAVVKENTANAISVVATATVTAIDATGVADSYSSTNDATGVVAIDSSSIDATGVAATESAATVTAAAPTIATAPTTESAAPTAIVTTTDAGTLLVNDDASSELDEEDDEILREESNGNADGETRNARVATQSLMRAVDVVRNKRSKEFNAANDALLAEIEREKEAAERAFAENEWPLLLENLPPSVRDLLDSSAYDEEYLMQNLVEMRIDLNKCLKVCWHNSQRTEVIGPDHRFTQGEFSDAVELWERNDFFIGDDNRLVLPRTLHRLSVDWNRSGDSVIKITVRIGKHCPGAAALLQDVLAKVAEGNLSMLLLGPPGSGKTTLLRECAAKLSSEKYNEKHVCVIDTSAEIAGDGDEEHASIGDARRFFVESSQADTMKEVVQNHTPDVIIIDEISDKAQVMAASTIRQRGVNMIATAHGKTLRDLLGNSELNGLVGGKQQVTLGDKAREESGAARKNVAERGGKPIFDIICEVRGIGDYVVHNNTAQSVDALLDSHNTRGKVKPALVSRRWHKENASTEVSEEVVQGSNDAESSSNVNGSLSGASAFRVRFAHYGGGGGVSGKAASTTATARGGARFVDMIRNAYKAQSRD